MKFASDQEKRAAIVAAANEWGRAMAACKVAEWELTEVVRGFVPDSTLGAASSPAMSATPLAAIQPPASSTAPIAATTAATTQEEEKKKRIRRTREQIAADEAANKAKAEAMANTPPESVPGPATTPASSATLDDVREAMNALWTKWGGAPETRAKVMEVVKAATGKTRAVDLVDDEFGKAMAALKAELAA